VKTWTVYVAPLQVVSSCPQQFCMIIPTLMWTVKAAKKLKSCLCCLPGEGDEEEEDDEDGENADGEFSVKPMGGKLDLSIPGAFASNNTGRSKYVDGKAQFAFDPTMFNK